MPAAAAVATAAAAPALRVFSASADAVPHSAAKLTALALSWVRLAAVHRRTAAAARRAVAVTAERARAALAAV